MSSLLLILYVISVILSFMVCRKFSIKVIEDFSELVMMLIFMFIPIINIVFIFILFITHYEMKEYDIDKIIKKIFFLK